MIVLKTLALVCIVYCVMSLLSIISLGGFQDNQEFHSLLVPFIIAVLTCYIIKPLHDILKYKKKSRAKSLHKKK